MISYVEYNEKIKEFGREGVNHIITIGKNMGITHRNNSPSQNPSLDQIKVKFGADRAGVINRITFTPIRRSLIYTMYGAGKGRAGVKGSRWKDKFGRIRTPNTSSKGKMGTEGRTPKPFITAFLDSNEGVSKAADIAAESLGDAIAKAMSIK